MIGLICDPVANRVEVPCLGKNVMAASNAVSVPAPPASNTFVRSRKLENACRKLLRLRCAVFRSMRSGNIKPSNPQTTEPSHTKLVAGLAPTVEINAPHAIGKKLPISPPTSF